MGVEDLLQRVLHVDVGRNARSEALDDVRITAVLEHGDFALVFAVQHLADLRVREKAENRTVPSSSMSTLLRHDNIVPMHVSRLWGGSFSIMITPTLVSRFVM